MKVTNSSSSPVSIGVDLGGTKILALVIDEAGAIQAERSCPTPNQDFASILQAMAELCAELRGGLNHRFFKGLGVGAPGPLDPKSGVVFTMPNLPGKNLPLGEELSKLCGLPVVVENDANAALVGELRFGAAREAQEVVLYTLGTGVGGAVASRGQIIHGARGAAGELGHITVEAGGRLCGCGRRGCLETVASGRSAGQIAAESLGLSKADSAELLRRWAKGDEAASAILDRIVAAMASASSALINALNPELIVLGGGFGEAAAPYLIPRLKESLQDKAFAIALERLSFAPAVLGAKAGALGAAALALA